MEQEDIWKDAEVISAYSREDAIEDGVLVDISKWAREADFRYPVAVTQAVWGILEPSEVLAKEGQSAAGRAWDMLAILRMKIRSAGSTDAVQFAPLFVLEPGHAPETVELRATCGPGDSGAPVVTVMLPNED